MYDVGVRMLHMLLRGEALIQRRVPLDRIHLQCFSYLHSVILGMEVIHYSPAHLDLRSATPWLREGAFAAEAAQLAEIAEAVDVPRYYLGIIDVLQQWDWSKRVERWTKIIVKKR